MLSSNGVAKATSVFAAMATAAMAVGMVCFAFFHGERRHGQPAVRDEQRVVQAYERMVAVAESLDVDELYRHVVDTDKGCLIANGQLFLTRAEALNLTRSNFQGIAALKYQIRDRHVTMLSPELALLVATGASEAKIADGRTISNGFAHTVVFVKQGGEWRVLHSHQSTPVTR